MRALATRDPSTSAIRFSNLPKASPSRKTFVSVPPWGTADEWNCSLPEVDWRHWKNRAPSAPRAMCDVRCAMCDVRCAMCDVRQAVAGELAWCLCEIAGLPVHGRGRVLDEKPGVAAGQAAHTIGAERELAVALGVAAQGVVVVGHKVDLARPGRVVGYPRMSLHHEVGGDGDVGADAAKDVPLRDVVAEQGIAGESLEVQ
jgi:hypothetical protein